MQRFQEYLESQKENAMKWQSPRHHDKEASVRSTECLKSHCQRLSENRNDKWKKVVEKGDCAHW